MQLFDEPTLLVRVLNDLRADRIWVPIGNHPFKAYTKINAFLIEKLLYNFSENFGNATGSRRPMTGLKISWEGMSLGDARKRRNHASRCWTQACVPTPSSIPLRTALSTIIGIFWKGCNLFRVSRRGAGSWAR